MSLLRGLRGRGIKGAVSTQSLSQGALAVHQVSHHHPLRACGPGRQQHEQTDGTRTEDDNLPTVQVTGPSNGVHGGCGRLDEGGPAVVQVIGQRHHPVGSDREVVRHPAGRLATEHLEVGTDVVTATCALGQ